MNKTFHNVFIQTLLRMNPNSRATVIITIIHVLLMKWFWWTPSKHHVTYCEYSNIKRAAEISGKFLHVQHHTLRWGGVEGLDGTLSQKKTTGAYLIHAASHVEKQVVVWWDLECFRHHSCKNKTAYSTWWSAVVAAPMLRSCFSSLRRGPEL